MLAKNRSTSASSGIEFSAGMNRPAESPVIETHAQQCAVSFGGPRRGPEVHAISRPGRQHERTILKELHREGVFRGAGDGTDALPRNALVNVRRAVAVYRARLHGGSEEHPVAHHAAREPASRDGADGCALSIPP